MKAKHYNIGDKVDILLYSTDDSKTFPNDLESLQIKKLEDVEFIDVDPYIDYPIFEVEQFIMGIQPMAKHRNRERKLSEAGIETVRQLVYNYMLFKYKSSPLSKSIREMAVEKYLEVLPLFSPVKTSSEVDSGETKADSLPVDGAVTEDSTVL